MSKKHRIRPTPSKVRMYCGPNIPGIANPGMLFTEPPPILQEHITHCPALKAFIVDPVDYAAVKSAISAKGSLEETQYKKVLDYLKGEQ